MEGYLYQRGKSKIWYLRYWLPCAPGEGRIQKNARLGRLSKADAEAKKRQILRDLDDGILNEERSRMTVGTFLKEWLGAIQGNLAASTFVRYRDIVTRHITPQIGQIKLTKLRPEHLRGLYESVRGSGLSGRTALHVHRVLHTALEHAVSVERLLKENVAGRVKAPRAEVRELASLSIEQIKLLIDASVGTRLEVPMAVAATTGLRRGELLALRWGDVDLDKGSLFVSASLEQTKLHGIRLKPPKSKSSRRFIPLAPECVERLRQHRERQDSVRRGAANAYSDLDLVFPNPDGNPWPPNTFTTQFKHLAKSVGLTKFRFHDTRHFFASKNLANGHSIKEVQALLGHANPSVTLSVYARTMEGLGRRAVNELAHSLLSERSPATSIDAA